MAISSNRTLVKPFIPSLVREGLSANRIIQTFRALGLGYRRTDMLSDIREASGLAKLEGIVRSVDPFQAMPRYAMVETRLPADRRYRIFGKAKIKDKETGEEFEQMVSMYDDENKGKAGWTESWLDYIPETGTGEKGKVIDLEIVSVEHNQGWRY